MVRRLILAAAGALLAGAPAFAQPDGAPKLDPEPKQPYLWRVVLSARPHPLITPELRERVRRDVVAALQTGLGPLGTVEVIDLAATRDREPLWQQFEDKGFAALDAPRDLSGVKTHFLRLDYRDGRFHLEARQYDGFTGLASPLVRARDVRAADQVGRAAGLLLDRDFGLVGTVEADSKGGDAVLVRVRGSALGPLAPHVAPGDVFAVAAVRKTSRPAPAPVRTATGKIVSPPPGAGAAALTSTPRAFVLLKVTERTADGVRCAVLPGDPRTLPVGGVIGYRCMKLGTVAAPVAVRLVGSDGAVEKTTTGVKVQASDAQFADAREAKDLCTPNQQTYLFHANRELKNVACVTVTLGGQSKLFAVPVLTRDPVTIPFEVDPKKARTAEYQRAVLAASAAATDARLAQTRCFEEVARLINKQKADANKEALAHATTGITVAEGAYATGTEDLKRLREQLDAAPAAKPLLDKIERELDALKQSNDKLKEHVGKLAKVVELESNPRTGAEAARAEALNDQIKLLLSLGEVEQALASYERLLALVPGDAAKRAERDKVKAEWAVKDDAHKKARDYLLNTWRAVATIEDFKAAAVRQNDTDPPLVRNVEVCKKNGDRWTLLKLYLSISGSRAVLNKLVDDIKQPTDADRKLLADAAAVNKALDALEQELFALTNK